MHVAAVSVSTLASTRQKAFVSAAVLAVPQSSPLKPVLHAVFMAAVAVLAVRAHLAPFTAHAIQFGVMVPAGYRILVSEAGTSAVEVTVPKLISQTLQAELL